MDHMQSHAHHFNQSRESHDTCMFPYSHPSTNTGRVTDYPVGVHTGMSNHNHSFQSETDSLSTVSESSFTSDSSYAYDANRKPKKKILKKSNAPRKNHRHRVRWNLDNLESFSDTDNTSIDSSSSMSSSGRSYMYYHHNHERPLRVMENSYVQETTHDYRVHGHMQNHNSGLTSPTSNRKPRRNSTDPTDSSLHVPQGPGIYRTYSGSIYKPKSGQNPSHLPRQTGSLDNHYKPQSRPTLSGAYPFSQKYGDLHQSPPRKSFQQSTPTCSPRLIASNGQLNGSMDRVINVPVLHLDEGSVKQLNNSTLEERERRHLFEFPPSSSSFQQRSSPHGQSPQKKAFSTSDLTHPNMFQRSRSSSDVSNPQSLNSNSSSSMSSASTTSVPPVSSSFLPTSLRSPSPADSPQGKMNHYHPNGPLKRVVEDDDELDYDHLSDKESSSSPPIAQTAEQRLKAIQPSNQWYSDDDIEEALQKLEESEHDSEEDTERSNTPSFLPPPIPPKQRKQQASKVPPKTPPPPVPPKKQVLASVLAQEVAINDSSLSETVDGLILSPPQEFKGSSTPQNYHKQDPLHSPSCETLMPNDTSQSDVNLTPPEVHPENRASLNLKYSWMEQSAKLTEDRIVEGAEDPQRQQSPTSALPKELSSGFIPHISKVNTSDTGSNQPSVEELSNGIGGLSLSDDVGHYLHRHNSFSPRMGKQPPQSQQYQFKRSRTLPKDLTSTLTKEEEAVLQWRNKRPQMKPMIVDTEKEIEELMAGMDNDRHKNEIYHTPRSSPKLKTEKRGSFGKFDNATFHSSSSFDFCLFLGTCCVCNKTIDNSSSLVDFASRKYHSSCLCCSECGKEILYINNNNHT